MPSNTPLPAAEFFSLWDDIARAIELDEMDWARSNVKRYRAARAASPRTLEEDILTDIGRGFIKSDEIERQNRYPNDDEQAEMEKVLVRFEEHARRLAREGGV